MEVPGSPRLDLSSISRNRGESLVLRNIKAAVLSVAVLVSIAVACRELREDTSSAKSARKSLSGLPNLAGNTQELAEQVKPLSSNKTAEQTVECPQPKPRQVYYVNQLFWAWVHTLEVSAVNVGENEEQTVVNLGYVKSVPFSFSGDQSWTDPNGTLIASSHQDAITTVTNIYVDDCADRFLATISEQISPANSAVSLYTIQNPDGDIIAISTMSKNFGTEVDINDQVSGKRLVTISKGWRQVSDSWAQETREYSELPAGAFYGQGYRAGYGSTFGAGPTAGGTQYV